jgi:2-amino-4-hydroxy-6-hydroxymethyldihydropteridine diphosphokinase
VIFVGIGANLPSPSHGRPLVTCRAAIGALEARAIMVRRRSRWYASAPVPPSDQPAYVNGVLQVDTKLSAEALLQALHDVERMFGRRRGERNSARILDLDLLAYGSLTTASGAAVEVPHPRMHERVFVLQPLSDLAPWWRHPRLGRSAAELLAAVPPGQVVEAIEAEPAFERGSGLPFSPSALS